MKLDHLNITNFRCFESLNLRLERDVTVFVGVNGSGKSTILDATAFALYDAVAALSGVSGRSEHGVEVKQEDIYSPPVERRSTQAVSGNGSDSDGPKPGDGPLTSPRTRREHIHFIASFVDYYPVPGFTGGEGQATSIEWDAQADFRPPFDIKYHGESVEKTVGVSAYIEALWRQLGETPQDDIPLPAIAYYRIDRHITGTPAIKGMLTRGFRQNAAYVGSLNAGADFATTREWLGLQYDQELRRKAVDPHFKEPWLHALREAVRLIVDGVNDFRFEGIPSEMFIKTDVGGATVDLPLGQLSDGNRMLIAMVVDLAARLTIANMNSKSPLEAPGIMLIDEIELHLHPAWQQTIIPKLRTAFPGTQIIATTHSPQVLTSIEPRCIRILDGYKVHSAPEGTFGAESKRLLEEVLGVTSRPPEQFAPPVQKLNKLYKLINDNRLEEAKEIVHEFVTDGYASDPAVIEADLTVENKLWELAGKK